MEQQSYETAGQRSDSVVRRIRHIIGSVDLDCRCRTAFEETLDRFTALEAMRQARERLHRARAARLSVAALLDLLAELDDIAPQETDRSVFEELAGIFEAIGDEAREGAGALRELKDL
jgi:hypothetical protein